MKWFRSDLDPGPDTVDGELSRGSVDSPASRRITPPSAWIRLACLAAVAVVFAGHAETPARSGSGPNIIYILADDLGYGDLGCYGQSTLKTPNLDRLATEGMRFTRHYSGSTVCAPSRCVLLTGLHTGHCKVRGNGPGALGTEDLTFSTLLQKAGYRTGCFGKWGIGNPPPIDDPNRHGFDEFFGYVNMFHAHNYYPEFLVRNGRKVPLRNRLYSSWKEREVAAREGVGVAEIAVDYAPELISNAAMDFIRAHHDQPFFLYYALNIPHANNEGGREPRIENNGMRVPDHGEFAEKNWPIQEKGFARMIQSIDRDVGRILDLVERLEIDRKTLILFASDNGPHQEGGHRVDFFDSNGPLRGHKRDLYEGGIRTPFLARWPGTVPAGVESDHLSGFQDMFPTLLELAGVRDIPSMDGLSMVRVLRGDPEPDPERTHRHLYWEFHERGGARAVVEKRWKAVLNRADQTLDVGVDVDGAVELFDLMADPGETRDVSAENGRIVERMRRIMKREHEAPQDSRAQGAHRSRERRLHESNQDGGRSAATPPRRGIRHSSDTGIGRARSVVSNTY